MTLGRVFRGLSLALALLVAFAMMTPAEAQSSKRATAAEDGDGKPAHTRKSRRPKRAKAPVRQEQAPETSATKRKPTLLPANQRRHRSSTSPPILREDRSRQPRAQVRTIVPAPLPYARDVPGDRGPPLGVPPQYDPRWIPPGGPAIGTPALPPARQVPGESGVPLGPGPLSPVR